jgi:hypothetical protein
MDQWERDYHVARIVSGLTRVRVDGTVYWSGKVPLEHRYLAEEIYRETLMNGRLEGVFTEDEARSYLAKRGLWSVNQEVDFEKLNKSIEDLKAKLYESRSQSNARVAVRRALEVGREELSNQEAIRHSLDSMTITGVASVARLRVMIGAGLLKSDHTPYWKDPESDWLAEDPILDVVMDTLLRQRLGDSEIRELARTDPWRSIWSSRKHTGRGLFDCPSATLTDEQRSLIMWAGIYDNIYENPEHPSDDIIADDDMLDGWMIVMRRKRDSQLAQKEGEEAIGTNDKIRNADEVYIVANADRTIEDAVRIASSLNDDVSNMIKARRMNYLHEQKEVNEVFMPDSWERLQMEWNQLENKKRMGT